MSSLVDKIRAARVSTVAAGGHTYSIRRPTDAEAAILSGVTGLDIVCDFVCGWDHTEISLGIPGGSPVDVQFNAELWREWVADQPALWGPLAEAILNAYTAHAEKRDSDLKN